MPCYSPVGTYRKNKSVCFRPCGSCLGCRLEHSRQWAVRCHHEASLHEENSFITLTYNNENLPSDNSVHKSEIQNFIKRLRKQLSPKLIRYFGCGEYGEQLGRPHYHLCIFNHSFPDKEIYKTNPRHAHQKAYKETSNHTLYKSEQLQASWQKGYSTVGEMTFQSAAYVGRYITKKITGRNAHLHYNQLTPEFALMSRMPGIGKKWIEKYIHDVYPKDYFHINGRIMRPTRYYDSVMQKLYPEEFEKIKKKRSEHDNDDEAMRLWQRQEYRRLKTKSLQRSLENGNS